MALEYRWMQKKDLKKIGREKDANFIEKLADKKSVCHIFNEEDSIKAWIMYKLFKRKVVVVDFGFVDDQVANKVIESLKNRFEKKNIVIAVCERDLKLQMILKKQLFLARSILNQNFYLFVSQVI